jgi:hypothetical protein
MTAFDVLGTLRIEDGRRWVDAAYDFQTKDATAVLTGERPYHFQTRPRGASKTTDLAGVALAMLLEVRARERFYWLAADREEGQLAIDAAQGFIDRTPALRGALTVTASALEAVATGARLAVLAADAASSWGLRPFAVFCDEPAAPPAAPTKSASTTSATTSFRLMTPRVSTIGPTESERRRVGPLGQRSRALRGVNTSVNMAHTARRHSPGSIPRDSP